MSSSQTNLFRDRSAAKPTPPRDLEAAVAHLSAALGLGPDQSPFPWQKRLLQQLLAGQIPRALDIPTGLGKTSTMAIWLVARALGADLPRKLVYVVDRRAVVDQATTEAEKLRGWLGRSVLRESLGLMNRALPLSTLRGKLADNREWMDDPADPSLVIGTVDMIGSRLLFEGYRSTRKIRPYLAGLLGHDTLFVLDEAHLVPPFERLMERIGEVRSDLRPQTPSLARPPRSQVLSLSATGRSRPGSGGEEAIFRLNEDDRAHPVVKQRLNASKRLRVVSLESADEIPAAAAARAWDHAQSSGSPARYLLYFNRRTHAEAALEQLRDLAGLKKLKKGEVPAADVELLVGGRRIFERQRAQRRLEELGYLADSAEPPQRPVFLFATSAGEVGIDLDADHMFGDRVPWERMIQRLGRVNRRGSGEAEIFILDAPLDNKAEGSDQARREAVLDLLQALPPLSGGGFNASPGALALTQGAAAAEIVRAASTPEPLYPALERATLDDWSMTSLPPHAGRPSITPWLRGWISDEPQTTVVWRTHFPLLDEETAPSSRVIKRYFEATPPHVAELLETGSAQVAKWLNTRVKRMMRRGIDPKTVVAMTRASRSEDWKAWSLQALFKASANELDRTLQRGELVLLASLGGLVDGLLDDKSDAHPLTADGTGEGGFDDSVSLPFRVLKTDTTEPPTEGDWSERARFPVAWTAEGLPSDWLVVHRRATHSTNEHDRSAGPDQTLEAHQISAEKHAKRLADRLGLDEVARHILMLAARLHDEGKRAERWQRAFRARGPEPLAKTRGPVNVHALEGYRHEFGSLPYAEQDPRVQALPAEQRDLVLHLIASHHGFARPLIRTDGCDDAPPSVLERRAQEVALRFFRLQTAWGPWGLAWWESLLRAADQQASKENQAQYHKTGGSDAAREAR